MDFLAVALTNPVNRAILERLPRLGLADVHLVAGCIYQTYWNVRSGRPPTENIKDYDLFYFDDRDLSYEAEDRVVRAVAAATADLGVGVDVKNQARVHLWYHERFGVPRSPLKSCREAIASFTSIAQCVGIAVAPDGALALVAPYGLADTLAGVLRLNPHCPSPKVFRPKAEAQKARWPWLRIVEESDAPQSSGN